MRDGRNHDEDESEIRDQIYNYIKKNPGAHLRMIIRDLEMGMGATQHHLDILENSGKIRSKRINIYRHYYVVEVLEVEHNILAFLRQETARDILVYLMEYPRSTQIDITNFMGFSAPTISWHMSRLEKAGLVSSIKEGRTVRYEVVDIQRMAASIKTYHSNIWDKLLSRFAELFLQMSSDSEEHDD